MGRSKAAFSVGIHVDQLFYRAPGGIGTYLRELIPALAAEDAELDLTLFHAPFAARPEPWLAEFRREILPAQIRRLYPLWNLTGRPLLPPPLRLADAIHAPSPVAIPPPAPGQRLVVTVHDLAFRTHPELFPGTWRLLFRTGMRRAVRDADLLLTVSEYTKDRVREIYGVDASRIVVTPLAASLPETPADPGSVMGRLGLSGPYVLSVGTLEPRKNLLRLVRAYRQAVAGQAQAPALVLAGPAGWGIRSLLDEVRKPGPGRVVLTGRVSPGDLDALYRGAEIFAYPSLAEGFGLPVLEAMARGVPVITSSISSLPEVAGDAALLVDPTSTDQIAEGLRGLLADDVERKRLSAAGIERARRFSWSTTARATLAAYRGTGHEPI